MMTTSPEPQTSYIGSQTEAGHLLCAACATADRAQGARLAAVFSDGHPEDAFACQKCDRIIKPRKSEPTSSAGPAQAGVKANSARPCEAFLANFPSHINERGNREFRLR